MNVYGAVTSGEGRGVVASTSDGTVYINLNETTTAKLLAIKAEAFGAGDTGVSITSAGAITSDDGAGVNAYATGTGFQYLDEGQFGIHISQTGDITSNLDAVTAVATDARVWVGVDGEITSYDGKGVYAHSDNGAVDVTTGAITSGLDAIYADAKNGAVTLDVGTIISYDGKGVYAHSSEGAVGVTINGSVSAELDAIYAQAENGAVTVTTTGGVTSYKGQAILAASLNGDVKVDIKGSVSAFTKGIEAATDTGAVDVLVGGGVTAKQDAITATTKDGSVKVDIDGNIVSDFGKGIYAQTPNGSVTIDARNITSKLDAIYAQSETSAVDVEVAVVTSYSGTGIYAQSGGDAVTLKSGDVTSELDAIYAQSKAGGVTVTAEDVLSNKGKGVYAQSNGDAVSVTLASLTSELDGIYAQSDAGKVTIDVDGGITSYKGKGIQALSDAGAVDIDVGGNLWAGSTGIYAITEDGVIDIAAKNVTGKQDAIHAEADNGDIDIDAGNIVSYDGKGIYAITDSGTVSITAGSVTSKLDGVYADSRDAAVTVDLTGGVTAYSGLGIHAVTAYGNVTVDVDGNIQAKNDAIYATSTGDSGSSEVDITAGGGIVSYSGRGIVASSARGTVTIDVAGALTAELGGIVATSTGTGLAAAIEITQTGALTSWTGKGIEASSAGGPVTVVTKAGVTAELDAITALSLDGANVGLVSVTNSGGDVVSYKGIGIVASSAREGVTVVNTSNILADTGGIWAASTGTTGTSLVDVTQTGNITLAKGTGIHASSNKGTEVTLDGDITGGTLGLSATALAGTVTVTIEEDSVVSGAELGGAYLNAGISSLLTNYGDISSLGGLALEFDGAGAGTVDNYGTISGDFAFQVGAGTFNNYEGATYNAGTTMAFNGGGTFSNSGLLSLSTGLVDSVTQTTSLKGNLTQTSTGRLYADILIGAEDVDVVAVTGEANLGGSLALNLTGDLNEGVLGYYRFLTATDGVTLDGIKLSNPTLYGTIYSETGNDATIRVSGIDFDPEDIDTTVQETSGYIENIYLDGVPQDMKPLLMALASMPDMESYEAALDQLSPEQYAEGVVSAVNLGIGFSNRLLSCRVTDGPNRFKAEGDCDWMSVRGSVLEQDATADQDAYNQFFSALEAGSQIRIDDTWRLGGGIGLSNSVTTSADGTLTTATQGQAGVVLKYDSDALLLASALTAGYAVNSTERHVSIGSFDDTLTGDAPIAFVSARLHGAYTFEMEAAYIKPLFNLDLTATHFGGTTETGGGASLTIDPGTQYTATFNPAIELGGEMADENGNLIRPFVQLGLEASLASDLELTARFTGVDPSLGDITIPQPATEPAVKVSIGADILTKDTTTMRLFYDGAFTATSRKNGVGLKLSSSFW